VKRLLLAGGGHAHLEVIRRFALHRADNEGIECVLASPDSATAYSGMLPGVIAGHYAPQDLQIDLAALAASAGWRFVPQALQALDAAQRVAILADGSRLSYDVLSLDAGSVADFAGIPGAAEYALSVRPFAAFLPAWESTLAAICAGEIRELAVAGGGDAGVEIAMAMAYRIANTRGAACKVALVTDEPVILARHTPAVRAKFEALLRQQGIALHCASAVAEISKDGIHTARGESIAARRVIWAAAGTAPAWPGRAGIATDRKGYVLVDRHLQSLSHKEIFGGGDIVSLSAAPHPKSGVYAVRHGPVLAANLRAVLSEKALRPFVAQRRALSIVSAGGKYAIACWGGWSIAGSWVWNWKDRIDRGFIAKYDRHGR
jgi:pyridine nucleotide-disulfide oxidoreductase family protein